MTTKWMVSKSMYYPKWLAAQAKTTRNERIAIRPRARYFDTWREAFDYAYTNGGNHEATQHHWPTQPHLR